MRNSTLTTMILGALMSFTGQASAQDVVSIDTPPAAVSTTPIADFIAREAPALALDPQDQRPVAIEYSDAHETRAKIHKYASWATLPLMGAEFALGEKLYNDTNSETDSLRGVHGAVGAGLIGLFGVNSVTGLWNLLESNQAPGHTKRLVHGIMMLAAEGGLVASAASAPGHSRNSLGTIDTNKATHRDIAFVSIGVGTAGYLLMLLTKN
jgi:hypothetical protein